MLYTVLYNALCGVLCCAVLCCVVLCCVVLCCVVLCILCGALYINMHGNVASFFVKKYMMELKDSPELSEDSKKTIFMNIDEIEDFHKT